MNDKSLNRRFLLSGGTALLSAALLPLPAVAEENMPLDAEYFLTDPIDEEILDLIGGETAEAADARRARQALFQMEFKSWLVTATARFVLPVSARAVSATHTELRITGLSPALTIDLTYDGQINVHATWSGIFWDIVSSHDVFAQRDHSGWRNASFIPEAQRLHPTQEECWREDGFEPLLEWVNTELAVATHLALYGSSDWTAAALVRNGTVLRTGRSAEPDRWLAHLLPIHGRDI